MAQFESSIKPIAYSQERIYTKLSDLNNLSSVKERLAGLKEQLDGKIQEIEFDSDTITFTVQGMKITLRIIEREPCKCIKFESENSPLPLNLWIQIVQDGEENAKLKVTIRAEVNMFMKTMVTKPLQEAANKIADMLAFISY
ncbi:MAG: SRPBCC family protein [Phocaeicola sp.]